MPDNDNAAPVGTGATSVTNVPATGTVDGQAVNPAAASAPAAPSVPGAAAVNDPIVPVDPAMANVASVAEAPQVDDTNIQAEVVRRIGESTNVLVALSSDPSVDEMAAAIGLSLYLDKLGKRATAIYSGATPNALEFLKPEETFEPSVDALQDFVIALNKDKADHLRYKLDGDYVKIYITPYRTKISEGDLDFSYGDFNVDLVLALDVANGVDLDAALREHGRIMHDASIVNITTSKPGKLGEVEWSDKSASSVSEMIARLLYSINGQAQIEKEEATAFLTGIVAATNRFSNANTTPATMKIASRLMESGANQQLISKNITPDIDNEMFTMNRMVAAEREKDNDPTKLNIEHGNEGEADEGKVVSATVAERASTLLDDLKAAEASLASAGAETVAEASNEPLKIDSSEMGDVDNMKVEETPSAPTVSAGPEAAGDAGDTAAAAEVGDAGDASNAAEASDASDVSDKPASIETSDAAATSDTTSDTMAPELPKVAVTEEPDSTTDGVTPEKVIQPPSDFVGGLSNDEETEKYGHMLEDAISDLNTAAAEMTTSSAATDGSTGDAATGDSTGSVATGGSVVDNPAASSAPTVASNPEINGVPEINYMPMPGDSVLPPPPAPPIDMNSADAPTSTVTPIQPAAPAVPETPSSLGSQPSMQDQVYTPQASDPSAFKIPGM